MTTRQALKELHDSMIWQAQQGKGTNEIMSNELVRDLTWQLMNVLAITVQAEAAGKVK
jgi:hypothetical protein